MKKKLFAALVAVVVGLTGCGTSKEEQQREADKQLLRHEPLQKGPQKEY